MATIVYTKPYLRILKKFLRKHPELLHKYEKVLELLSINPWHPILRLHALTGDLKGIYGLSLTSSYRITLYFYMDEDRIVLLDIGSHDEVY